MRCSPAPPSPAPPSPAQPRPAYKAVGLVNRSAGARPGSRSFTRTTCPVRVCLVTGFHSCFGGSSGELRSEGGEWRGRHGRVWVPPTCSFYLLLFPFVCFFPSAFVRFPPFVLSSSLFLRCVLPFADKEYPDRRLNRWVGPKRRRGSMVDTLRVLMHRWSCNCMWDFLWKRHVPVFRLVCASRIDTKPACLQLERLLV